MTDPFRKDYAFLANGDHAVTHDEQMYSGALSFCRRRFARDLAGVDLAVIGVPFDTAVSNRPGCRFGPRGGQIDPLDRGLLRVDNLLPPSPVPASETRAQRIVVQQQRSERSLQSCSALFGRFDVGTQSRLRPFWRQASEADSSFRHGCRV